MGLGLMTREQPAPEPTPITRPQPAKPRQTRTAALFGGMFTLVKRCMPWGRYRALVAPYWLTLALVFLATAAHVHGYQYLPVSAGLTVAGLLWWGPALSARWQACQGKDVQEGSTQAGFWLDRTPERVYALIVVLAATALVTLVAHLGWSPAMGWLWACSAVVGALPWQWHYQWWLRTPLSSQIAAAWPECVSSIAQLKGATLGPNVGVGDVERHLITVAAGKEVGSILTLGGAVGGILELPAGTVTITLGDEEENLTDRQAWITKSLKAKLKVAQVFEGPTLGKEGTFHIANAPAGPILAVAHDKDGVKHAMGIGDTGSGKGSLHSLHLINRVETGYYLPFLAEGKGGTSVHGAIQDACFVMARTPAEWERLVNGLWRAMQVRKTAFGDLRITRYRIWEMWQEFPAVYLSMDEMPALSWSLSNQAKKNLQEMGEQGRSLGFAIGGFGQSSRGDMIPGGTVMRGRLTGGGTAWYGRAGDGGRDKSVIVEGREYDLTRFPAGPGWGYITGGAVAGTAMVKARALWVPDDPDTRDDLTGWKPSKPLPQLPEAELKALAWDQPEHDQSDSATAAAVSAGPAVKIEGPTAEDAILKILQDAADKDEHALTMGEIVRRTAHMPWREGRPYDKSTIRERLDRMVGRVTQTPRGWKLG